MARRPLFKAASSFAAILILAAGCSDHAPTAVQLENSTASAAQAASRGPKANVVKSTYSAGTYAAVIGPQGGTIDFGIGSLEFPAGALNRATRITATTDGEKLGVEFGPHGLQFSASHQPKLSFQVVAANSNDWSGLGIVYVDAALHVLEVVASEHNVAAGVVRGKLSHFSTYAIAKD